MNVKYLPQLGRAMTIVKSIFLLAMTQVLRDTNFTIQTPQEDCH